MLKDREKVAIGVLAVFIIVVAFLIIPPGPSSRSASPIAVCENNLSQIHKALERYHIDFGSYPPAYVADDNGKPMYSWRVLLLPYLEQGRAYDQFDLSQPWDGENNKSLVDFMLLELVCPSRRSDRSRDATTNYLAVSGPNTAWHGSTPVSKNDLGDDLSKTILLVEVADPQPGLFTKGEWNR